MKFKGAGWLGVSILLGSWSASAAGATTPLQGTQELVEAVKSPGKDQDKALKKIRTYFDYAHLVEVPIEPHKSKLSAAQLKRYETIFRELLENAPLIASVGDNSKLDYRVGQPVTQKDDVVRVGLSAYNPKTDMETDVGFLWKQQESSWQVVDVTLDGVSLVKGYQNQFGRILNKEGADGFLARLEKRLVEVRSGRPATGS